MKAVHGYVATLDVLGFADLLYREDSSDVLQLYMDRLNDALVPLEDAVECVLFSDSVVLTASGSSDEAFESIVRACAGASYSLLMAEIPVRGAIAYGSYWREVRNGSLFLAGQPIVEAYRRERAQNWVGTMLCPSVLRQQVDLNTRTRLLDKDSLISQLLDNQAFQQELALPVRLQLANIPFRDGGDTGHVKGFGIVPMPPVTGAGPQSILVKAAAAIRRVRSKLEVLQIRADRLSAQEKYNETISWLSRLATEFSEARTAIRQATKELPSYLIGYEEK